jgi:hypothetical protein
MRLVSIIAVVCGGAHAKCTKFSVSDTKDEIHDVIVLSNEEPSVFIHCSRIWPNEQPHLAVYPAPPGCLFDNSEHGMWLDGETVRLDWLGETDDGIVMDEWLNTHGLSVACESVVSRTSSGLYTVLVGKGCNGNACDTHAETLRATATCELERQVTRLEQDWR